jgi:hypothetical protein
MQKFFLCKKSIYLLSHRFSGYLANCGNNSIDITNPLYSCGFSLQIGIGMSFLVKIVKSHIQVTET